MTPLSYVLGFLFDAQLDNVVLIRKTKPKWQAGFLNGVGGKVHTHEQCDAAMHREFREETGSAAEWHPFARLAGQDWIVQCYYAVGPITVKTLTDEQVEIVPVAGIAARTDCLDNVPWLVLAARADWWSEGRIGIDAVYPAEEAA